MSKIIKIFKKNKVLLFSVFFNENINKDLFILIFRTLIHYVSLVNLKLTEESGFMRFSILLLNMRENFLVLKKN